MSITDRIKEACGCGVLPSMFVGLFDMRKVVIYSTFALFVVIDVVWQIFRKETNET